MKLGYSPFAFMGFLAVVTLFAWGIHTMSKLDWWICIVLAGCGVLLDSVLATYEDNLPGGFNNPDGSSNNTTRQKKPLLPK